MPVPSSINDIYTTASSNPPGGGETPAEGDNHIRAAYSFIAALRDILNGTSSSTAAVQTLIVSGAATFNGNTTIGNAGSDTLTVNASTTFADAVTFSANPAGRVLGGTYTPTLTNVSNVSSSTPALCHYMRIGDFILVAGQFSMTATTTGTTNTLLGISLPVASAIAVASNLSGAVTGQGAGSNGPGDDTYILADPTNDRAQAAWSGIDNSGALGFSFWFMYRVI